MTKQHDPAIASQSDISKRSLMRAWLWALPLLLSLGFVLGVLLWARNNEAEERALQRQTMISDALSTEAQLRAKLDDEIGHLRELAARLQGQKPSTESLAAQPELNAGLRRLWLSVTWLDQRNRIQAQLPAESEGQRAIEEDGLSLHLTAPVGKDGTEGMLVVRYAPALLLKRGVPWWLSHKYDIQMVDSADQVIASSTEGSVRLAQGPRPSYRVSFPGPLRTSPLAESALTDAALELTLRDPPSISTRPLALVLIAGFLPLIAGASWLLRRQVRHITRAESAWRTEAAWRRAMEDSALVGLRARDADGRLLYVNRTFCDMVGFSAESLVGLRPPMPYWPPDALEELTARNRLNLAGHAPREGFEARWRHADGRTLEVKVFESPLVDAAGKQIGWMGSIIDITNAKRLEEGERRQIEAMSHNARLTMLGEVASTLAHELNQPLTAIASYNAGITNSLAKLGVSDAAVLGALQRLGQQAAQAGRIVQRIRQFLTRREPQREACDLQQVLTDAVALLGRELRRAQVQVDLQLAAELPPLFADAVLIEQVVINLVRNAADALQARPQDRRIIICSSRSAGSAISDVDFLRIDVSDNGPGLAGRSAEALCAPFYSTKREGMGMGLAICRSIIEAHQGLLEVGESSSGGARFSFSLPLQQPAGEAGNSGESKHD
ncbi:PAS domain S-box protein [Paucibacter sp. B2R-40]|uniref:two-component system sensor histidine kinase NtrB n=1 Tax=Paucibacter sp. B2R-40 TaxID=2893554 RepID=UPI0021E43D95|nr:PAS domain S-box protein [Paucibacter sp. B2R-40]MCV2354489.1 PAS domain S-box protein [Paucibacter sp. B2R-40]